MCQSGKTLGAELYKLVALRFDATLTSITCFGKWVYSISNGATSFMWSDIFQCWLELTFYLFPFSA